MGRKRTPQPAEPPPADNGAVSSGGEEDTNPVHEYVGRQLKALFDEIVQEPVPDRFRKLLEELERQQ